MEINEVPANVFFMQIFNKRDDNQFQFVLFM